MGKRSDVPRDGLYLEAAAPSLGPPGATASGLLGNGALDLSGRWAWGMGHDLTLHPVGTSTVLELQAPCLANAYPPDLQKNCQGHLMLMKKKIKMKP